MSPASADAIPVLPVDVGPAAAGWFTGRPIDASQPPVGQAGNLAHRRPHVPARLAADRRAAADAMGLDLDDLVWMRQVHGADVGTVTPATPPGAELRDVDVLVTDVAGRGLVVQIADCVPLLLGARSGPVAAVHAGRRGVAAGVVEAALARLADLGADAAQVHAAIGPAIGGCCYEVPAALQDEVGEAHPAAVAQTTWGTPSLDLPAAVAATLARARVADVQRVGGCTRCAEGSPWFSHRADPEAGRQIGVVVRRSPS